MLLSAKSRKTVGKVSDIAEIAKNNAESLGMDNEHNAKQSVEQNFHAMSKAWRKQVNFLNTQRRQDLEEEAAILKAKIRLAQEKEQLDQANRQALEEIREKLLEIKRQEMRVKEQIEASKESFKIREELAETEARIEVCAKYEEEQIAHGLLDNVSCNDGAQEHIHKFLDSQEIAITTEQRGDEIPIDISASTQDNRVNNAIQDREASGMDLNPQATIFESAATTSRSVQPPPAEQHSHANAPTESNGNEIVGTSLIQSQLTAITKLLEIQSQNRLPLPEPGIFSGDHLKYPTWIRAFESLVESRATKPSDRLYFLSRYVSGEAKEVIQGFMLMEGDDAYQKAKEVLHKRYGDSFAVAAAFRKKLDAWPHIAPFDSLGLRRYADFLVQCEQAMKKVGSLRVLNDDQENQKMTVKLPKWASTRWGRTVYKWKKEKGEFPPFSEFVKYVVMEADIVCDPVNCRQWKTEEEFKGLRNKRDYRAYHGRSGTDPARTLTTRTKREDYEERVNVRLKFVHYVMECLSWRAAQSTRRWMSKLERNLPRQKVFVLVASVEDTFLENASGKNVVRVASSIQHPYMVTTKTSLKKPSKIKLTHHWKNRQCTARNPVTRMVNPKLK